jgi:hypothetical protein
MLSLVWMIGIYAIVFGAILVGLGFRVRSAEHHPRPVAPHPA